MDFDVRPKRNLLGMCCGLKDGNNYWCLSSIFDGLYKMDLQTGEVEFVVELPEKNIFGKQMYSEILRYKNSLYMIPYFADNVAVVNINTFDVSVIVLENKLLEQKKIESEKYHSWSIAGGCIYKNWLILYPGMGTYIYRIELDTKFIKKLCFTEEVQRYYANSIYSDYYIDQGSHYLKDTYLYIPLSCMDAVIKLDIQNFKIKYYYIDNNNTGYCAIAYANKTFWLAPKRKGAFVRWDELNNKIIRMEQYPLGFERKEWRSFLRMIPYKDKVYVLPCYANMLLIIDAKKNILLDGSFEKITDRDYEKHMYMESTMLVRSVQLYGDDLFIISGLANELIVYNLTENIRYIYCPQNDTEKYEKDIDKIRHFMEEALLEGPRLIEERYYFDNGDYIGWTIKQKASDFKVATSYIGGRIYENCVKGMQ